MKCFGCGEQLGNNEKLLVGPDGDDIAFCDSCNEGIEEAAEEIKNTPTCVLCGMCGDWLPECNLIRFTWMDKSDERKFRMDMVVAKNPQSNDRLVCEKCIRDIKRLPFSEFAAEEIAF